MENQQQHSGMASSQGHRNRFASATITRPFDDGAEDQRHTQISEVNMSNVTSGDATPSQGHRESFPSLTIPHSHGFDGSSTLSEIRGSNVNDQSSTEMNVNHLRVIKLPPKANPTGRPKGKVNKAVGLKKKPEQKHSDLDAKKIKFFDRSYIDQGLLIAKWFTNFANERIESKKKISPYMLRKKNNS